MTRRNDENNHFGHCSVKVYESDTPNTALEARRSYRQVGTRRTSPASASALLPLAQLSLHCLQKLQRVKSCIYTALLTCGSKWGTTAVRSHLWKLELSKWNSSVPPGAFTLKGHSGIGLGSGSVLYPWMHSTTEHPDSSLTLSPECENGQAWPISSTLTLEAPTLASWALLPVNFKAWEIATLRPHWECSFLARHLGLPVHWVPRAVFYLCPHAPHTLPSTELSSVAVSERGKEKSFLILICG